ncbi:MAG: hypothetical protein US18_C0035G0004 [Parcubacteria group bacterium GW2011_GWB1_36_5]|nr:MAG: hypothetical protein US18_C0035G0004 [Parcubacteria group bacterium GW2011_GWB1_36_5]
MKKEKNKNTKDDWEGFDDCAICQAMKNGKADNAEDLMKAFQEAEKSGIGKVGYGNGQNKDASILSPYSK